MTTRTALPERLLSLIREELDTIDDPEARVLAAVELVAALEGPVAGEARTIRGAAIVELRTTGVTWAHVGQLLGVSKQRAEQLAKA